MINTSLARLLTALLCGLAPAASLRAAESPRVVIARAAMTEDAATQRGLIAGLAGDADASIAPLLEAWRREHPEVELVGPLPPDTCWLEAGRAWQGADSHGAADGYLALYHDQGLIPVKLLAFDQAVNTSLGLPFLRTSPDHGTGFDIAGQGIARAASMAEALATAWELG